MYGSRKRRQGRTPKNGFGTLPTTTRRSLFKRKNVREDGITRGEYLMAKRMRNCARYAATKGVTKAQALAMRAFIRGAH